MPRYRKIEVKVWTDAKFRSLSPIPPCGQGLWLYLLTGPDTCNIPGCYRATEAGLASSLNWPLKAFREAFREIAELGMVEADWKNHVVSVANAIKYNPPQSPNVVKSWSAAWDCIPECELKLIVWQRLKAFLEGLDEAFLKAFAKACRKPSAKPSLNQEQYQEQEQEQKKDKKKGTHRFVPPSLLEVEAYLSEKGITEIDAESFVAFYESKGWKVGNQPMKSWQAAITTWRKRALASKEEAGAKIEKTLGLLRGKQ